MKLKFALQARTPISEKLSKQLEGFLTKYYADAPRLMRIGKYPFSLVGNMDKTPAFFDMVPIKIYCEDR